MKNIDWYNQTYRGGISDFCDDFSVEKAAGSEWVSISRTVNGNSSEMIVVRSRQGLEGLHFLIGQLLKE